MDKAEATTDDRPWTTKNNGAGKHTGLHLRPQFSRKRLCNPNISHFDPCPKIYLESDRNSFLSFHEHRGQAGFARIVAQIV